MKKLLYIFLIFGGSLACFAQTGPGWIPVRVKQNVVDSTYFSKDANFNSTVRVKEGSFKIGLITVTANGAELNLLDGALVNTTELNYLVGVTSNVQSQLNSKANTSHTHAQSSVTALPDSLLNKYTKAQTNTLLSGKLNITDAETYYVSYNDASSDINLGDKNLTTSGNIGASDNKVANGYFENITLTSPLKGNINSDSIIWSDGSIQPSISLNIKDLEVLGSTVKAMTLGMTIGETKASVTMVDNSMKVIPVYLRTPQVITGVKIGMATQGDYTADNYNGVGLYKYNTTLDSLVLISSSTNDGNIWKASSGTMITKAFSSLYSADAGLYYVGCLWNNSASVTTPVVYGTTPGIWIGGLLSSGYFVAGAEAGQNTFPAKYKASDINTSGTSYLLFLY